MVHNGDVIRIGPDVTGHAYIWNAQTKQFELSANKVAYPEGWYCTDFNGGK